MSSADPGDVAARPLASVNSAREAAFSCNLAKRCSLRPFGDDLVEHC